MTVIEWDQMLPEGATVIFSSLTIPDCDRDELDRDVAEIHLLSGLVIDVEWLIDEEEYLVTLYRDDIESPMTETLCKTASDVVRTVIRLADDNPQGDTWTAYSATSPRSKATKLEYA